MSYTKEQLTAMAKEVVEAEKAGDSRALELFVKLALRVGMSPKTVRTMIHRMAM